MAIALLNDYHDALGKRIVYATLRAGGYVVQDYGRVEADELVERVMNDRLDLILISVLMLSSALEVKHVSRKLREHGCRVKIAVGGAPFRLDHDLWQIVEADVTGFTASDALVIARATSREAQP
ncbi:MAG: cobalamin-dependent protein [Desulfovermiculus sp.]